jgi:prephenate dehydratase
MGAMIMMVNIMYLGPQGTFSEEAALRFGSLLEEPYQLIPCNTVTACAEAVEDAQAGYAVVPLENSLEGSVNETLDVLTTGVQLTILAELVMDIEHALLTTGSGAESIDEVYSHPQALAQCRSYLRRMLPEAKTIPVLSTADAAEHVSRIGGNVAAIGSVRAADCYGLQIFDQGIQDSENRTRFIVLGKQGTTLGPHQKTSLVFSVRNVAGSLFQVLQAFAAHSVNLTRIESRPAKKGLGDYIFFVDLDGSPSDSNVRAALRQAADEAVMLKLLGSYPVFS